MIDVGRRVRPKATTRPRRHPVALSRSIAALATSLMLAGAAGAEGGAGATSRAVPDVAPSAAPSASARNDSPFPQPRDTTGRFLNLEPDGERGGLGVTLPFFLRRLVSSATGRAAWATPVTPDRARLATAPVAGTLRITWVGHATFLAQMPAGNVLTDPIWAERASPFSFMGPHRMQAPGIPLADLPRIDAVVVSLNHYELLDQPTLGAIARRNPEAIFAVPLGNAPLLVEAGVAPNRIRELGWGDRTIHHGLTLTALPVQHWSQRWTGDRNEDLWASWAVSDGDRNFYFGGDTGTTEVFRAIGKHYGPFDLAALPIGAYSPRAMMRPFHMNPEEAAHAGRAVAARRMVGMHFATFDLSDEPPAEPPERFVAAAQKEGFARGEAFVLRIGETRDLSDPPAADPSPSGRKAG